MPSEKTTATNPIHVGTADVFIFPFTYDSKLPETIAAIDALIEAGTWERIGYLNDGAEGTYTCEYTTYKDDQGIVSRTKLSSEEFKMGGALENYSGETITKLIPTARVVTTETGDRVTKIGGIANDSGNKVKFGWCFMQRDEVAGDCAIIVYGQNTSDFTITEKVGDESKPSFEVTAESQDREGTLIHMVEENLAAAAAAEVSNG